MSAPTTATEWAWGELRKHTGAARVGVPQRLTLLAAADLLDRAVARGGGDMFHHDVLDQTVVGFDGADLHRHIGVTGRTCVQYCRDLVAHGLLEERQPRHFTLPASAWSAATPSD